MTFQTREVEPEASFSPCGALSLALLVVYMFYLLVLGGQDRQSGVTVIPQPILAKTRPYPGAEQQRTGGWNEERTPKEVKKTYIA
jgi:hypothetical protein